MEIPHFDLPSQKNESDIDVLRTENQLLKKKVAILEKKISLQPQTGLPTHFRLEIELEQLIESVKKNADSTGFSLVIIQLGANYKTIRKTVKTTVSEWILYQTACRISNMLGKEDKVFHTHEDEFVLLIPGLKGKSLSLFISKLILGLGKPHVFSSFNLSLHTHIGIAYWPEHAIDRSSILHYGDIAVGVASCQHKNFVVFKPELLRQAVEKIELQNSIIKAIEDPMLKKLEEQFFLVFQPKLYVSKLADGVLEVDRVEAEVLMRWNHPEKGLIGPSTFIPLAEETGLIIPLGKWLIYQCMQQLATWKKAGKGDVSVSINLSAHQFRTLDVVDILKSAISIFNINPASITIEITETSLFEDTEMSLIVLKRFKELGVFLSLDDFGTGFSSLSHLHRFSLDEIKIDMLFVEHLSTKKQDQIIVKSLVSIAKGLGVSLIAEGVETREVLELLCELGCYAFQGYLFSKPLLPNDFIQYYDKVVSDDLRITLPD